MKAIIALFVIVPLLTGKPPEMQAVLLLAPIKTASVSFEGLTQAGKELHSLEVRRIAYTPKGKKDPIPGHSSYVVYNAGDEHGPEILKKVEAVEPFIRLADNNTVDLFFTTGAHTHVHQRWKLLGHTAKLISEKGIDWKDDPRRKASPQ